MKTYEEMAQSALARGKAVRKERKARNARLLKGIAGLAACCLVVVLVARMARMGIQLSPPAQDLLPGPSPMQPTNLRFDSIAQLRELLDLADDGQEALDDWFLENGFFFDTQLYTPEKLRKFHELLNTTILPCRDDYDDHYFTLYYYQKEGNLELFCDVNGIRYCFMSSTSAARAPDGAKTTAITLDGVTGELWEDDFGSERRLFAIFQVDGRTIRMWADTTDPNRVDLSGFFWGNILTDTE